MSIIETIRAEVEQLKEEHKEPTFRGDEYEEGGLNGYQLALDKVLAKLDTLQEKSEKPINPVCEDELYKEIERWINSPEEWDNNIQDIEATARHFAKWQKEQMEERWLKDRDGCFWDGVNEGKKAMREQMMKEAYAESRIVEDGRIELEGNPLPCLNPIILLPYPQFKPGDKVRIVIVKEEEK